MLTWNEFRAARPDMADFGEKRLAHGVMYLGTIREDGYPRVHPITAFVGDGHLFAFMEPTSPKARDLERRGKYAMHSLVTDSNGTGGEFQVTGQARRIDDPAVREHAVEACPFNPKDRYILFDFLIESSLTNEYTEAGLPNVQRWKS